MPTTTPRTAPHARGRWRTRAGAALAPLALVLAACATSSVLELEVGDCLRSADLGADEVSSVETVDCAEAHDAEVYSELALAGEEYPGAEVVEADAEAHCRTAFEVFVGLDYDSSEILYTTMYPTERSWNQAEDRTALCILLAPEDVTGTLEGAGY